MRNENFLRTAAATLLHDNFPGISPLDSEQPDDCRLSILIPAYDEQPSDILKQLSWLMRQQINLKQIEVIYAVNNKPSDGSELWQQAYERNQALLSLPIFQNSRSDAIAPKGAEQLSDVIRQRLAIFAIDMSSPEYAVANNNVGVVRQRLLGEGALRFAQRERNGILMFSDADSYIDSPDMLQTALDTFQNNQDLLAVPGALQLEIDPKHPEGESLAANFERVKLACLWHIFLQAWQKQQQLTINPLKFYGPCMLTRAYEAANTGGFSTADRIATDVTFGEQLVEYAANTGRSVIHGRELSIGVVNALRWSVRTRNNVLNDGFALATKPGPMAVSNPLDTAAQPDKLKVLTPDVLAALADAVRQLPNGDAYVDYMLHQSLIAKVRIASQA